MTSNLVNKLLIFSHLGVHNNIFVPCVFKFLNTLPLYQIILLLAVWINKCVQVIPLGCMCLLTLSKGTKF